MVNGENAFSQAQIWSYGLESYINKATKSRAEVIFWPQMIWNVVSILFTLLLSLGLLSIFAKIPQQSHWWIYLTIGILWTSVITYSSSLSPQWRSWRYQLFQYLQQTQISEFSLLRLLLLFATLFVYSFLLHNLYKIYQRKLIKSLGLLLELVCHLFGWVIIAQFWGLELGLILLGLGLTILAIAIRFSGSLVISIEKPFQLGDLIEIDDLVGTVVKIDLNSTEITTLDQTQVIIPNHYFLVRTFTNWSKGENAAIRLSIPIAVRRNTDIKKLKAAVLEGAKNHPDVLNSPRPFICFEKLGGDCLEFSLLFWIEAKDKQLQIKSDLNYRIEANLQRYQIKLANYQQNVYLESPK